MTCNCENGLASGIQCQYCPAGKTEKKFEGGSSLQVALPPQCRPCEAGSWSSATEVLNASCNSCDQGRYNSIFGASTKQNCLLCPVSLCSFS